MESSKQNYMFSAFRLGIAALLIALSLSQTSTSLAANDACVDRFGQRNNAAWTQTSPTSGSLRNRIVRMIERIVPRVLRVMNHVLINGEGKSLQFTNASGESLDMGLGRRLGFGMFGSVYRLTKLRLARDFGRVSGELDASDLVAKFPHAFRWNERTPVPLSERMNREEAELFAVVDRVWNDYRNSRERIDGTKLPGLPVLPILATIESDRGTVLLKPLVAGRSIEDLARNRNEIGPREHEQLMRLFDTIQEVEHALALAKDREPLLARLFHSGPLDADLNLRNLVYLPKQEIERLRESGVDLGIEEGFVLFELSLPKADGRTAQSFNLEFHEALDTFGRQAR